jgi:hypothetical protein
VQVAKLTHLSFIYSESRYNVVATLLTSGQPVRRAEAAGNGLAQFVEPKPPLSLRVFHAIAQSALFCVPGSSDKVHLVGRNIFHQLLAGNARPQYVGSPFEQCIAEFFVRRQRVRPVPEHQLDQELRLE